MIGGGLVFTVLSDIGTGQCRVLYFLCLWIEYFIEDTVCDLVLGIRTTEKIIIFTCANKWNKYGKCCSHVCYGDKDRYKISCDEQM